MAVPGDNAEEYDASVWNGAVASSRTRGGVESKLVSCVGKELVGPASPLFCHCLSLDGMDVLGGAKGHRSALILRPEWCEQIFKGCKPWEIRSHFPFSLSLFFPFSFSPFLSLSPFLSHRLSLHMFWLQQAGRGCQEKLIQWLCAQCWDEKPKSGSLTHL